MYELSTLGAHRKQGEALVRRSLELYLAIVCNTLGTQKGWVFKPHEGSRPKKVSEQ